MGKKCNICGKNAEFVIRGTSDYYCKEHAEEFFGDVSILESIEEQANNFKKALEMKISSLNKGIEELDAHVVFNQVNLDDAKKKKAATKKKKVAAKK